MHDENCKIHDENCQIHDYNFKKTKKIE